MKRKTPSFNHQLTFRSRRKRRHRWILAAFMLPLAAGIAFVVLHKLQPPAPIAAPLLPIETPEVAAAPAPEPPPPVVRVDIEYVVRPKDSLGQIFARLQLDVTEVPAILAVPAVRDRFRALQPDEKLTFALEDGALHAMRRRIGPTETLVITRGEGGFAAEVVETPIEVRTAHVQGTLDPALLVAGRIAGLSPEMLGQLANEIFAWDIDFALDVRPGDRFNVIYEQTYRDGRYLGDGHIAAAEIIIDDEAYRAVRYVSADGKVDGYFTPDGHNVRRQFLRAPVDFAAVNVNANPNERHPVLHLMQEHHGIDYPVPAGTAVRAAGDGRIEFIGESGEYGNTVVVDHGGSVSTVYAHLSTFARELKRNRRVKQSDVIGYAGYSGAATAPHLHYEHRVDGKPMNPRAADASAGEPIPAEYRVDFQAKAAVLLEKLSGPNNVFVTAALEN